MDIPPILLVLHHCHFGEDGPGRVEPHEVQFTSYVSLQYLYAVTAIDEGSRQARLVSSVLIKTNVPSEDQRFFPTVVRAFGAVPALRTRLPDEISLTPARVEAAPTRPLSAAEARQVFELIWSQQAASRFVARVR